MQQTIQLDVSSDIFDKVISFMEQLLNLLHKNKVQIKEIKNIVIKPRDEYFYSEIDRYIFAFTQLDGKNRQKILGINRLHYGNSEMAKKWKKEMAKKIHPDICKHPKAKEAWDIMNEIYSEMVGK